MANRLHQAVVDLVHQAIGFMDDLMRETLDAETYAEQLRALDVDRVLEEYRQAFQQDAGLVYYLDALMILSSLQHELDYQVAEYGVNVASEDIKMLRELLPKFNDSQTRIEDP
jgi:dsDNA-specific endonuclease/ATPase MutS2